MMEQFSYTAVPLDGSYVIEASAGTGKTYSIAGLYLRLVVEKEYPVDKILVVTFTDAATEELRDRIRRRLVEARDALRLASADEFTDEMRQNEYLLEAFSSRSAQWRKKAADNADIAVKSFDEAAISTIHSFCQRILRENAFEYSSLFNAELISDQTDLLDEITRDFCRQKLLGGQDPETVMMFKGVILEAGLEKMLASSLSKPTAALVPEAITLPEDIKASMKKCAEAFRKAVICWNDQRGSIIENLAGFGGWKKSFSDRIDQRGMEMDAVAAADDPMDGGAAELTQMGLHFIENQIKKEYKDTFSPHPFFALWQNYLDLRSAYEHDNALFAASVKAEFIRFGRSQLAARKEERNVWSFDDLLSRVNEGLNGGNAHHIIKTVRSRFSAALIDEFQDTDPFQCRIFEDIFKSDDTLLFYIGDPKQAIYSFRGADIYAYTKAKKHAGKTYSLDKNRRSSQSLLDGVNALFGGSNPFLIGQDVGYTKASGTEGKGVITENGKEAPASVIWHLNCADEKKALSKKKAEEIIAEGTAEEIVSLLGKGNGVATCIDGRAVRPSDIAVLVEKNYQGGAIKKALLSRGVPAVSGERSSIFSSDEFYQLECILRGVLDPYMIPAASTTLLYGFSAADLESCMNDDMQWNAVLESFAGYRMVWEKEGFMRMFRLMLSDRSMRERLVAMQGGLRRVTNLLHCGELIHRASVERGLMMQGTVQWMAAIRSGESDEYESELRLESDEEAVSIVTIHSSKGLEYPIVFVPFSWSGSVADKNKPLYYHLDDERQVIDCTPADDDAYAGLKNRAEFEMIGEKIRLLYVALTRAKYRFYFAVSKIGEKNGCYANSAAAYLIHGVEGITPAAGIEPLVSAVRDMTNKDVENAIREKMKDLGAMCRITVPPAGQTLLHGQPDAATVPLQCRRFGHVLADDWKISSFSYLVAGAAAVHKEDGAEKDDDAAAESEFFPAGSAPGSCLHEIFEAISFSADDDVIAREAAAALRRYGIDESYTANAVSLVSHTLKADLPLSGKLCDVDDAQCLKEMEFYFPAKRISPAGVRNLFGTYSSSFNGGANPSLANLDFSAFTGFLKGYIDCVFEHNGKYYIIDWKSNDLGSSSASYKGDTLNFAMDAHRYTLQCHIYALALHRFLAMRLKDYSYEKYFGGVYYLFIRGMRFGDGDAGIWHTRPDEVFIRQLEDLFIREGVIS